MHEQFYAAAVATRDDGEAVVVGGAECQHEDMAVGAARMMWMRPGITAAVAFRKSTAFDGYVTVETIIWFGSQPEKVKINLAVLVGLE